MSGLLRALPLAALVGAVACATPTVVARWEPGPAGEPGPRFNVSGPHAADFGAADGYPKGTRTTFYDVGTSVGSHSHLDEIFPGRLVHRAEAASRLERAPEPRITWRLEGEERTLNAYLARQPATGLLIARGNTILVERYQYARTDRDRFTSWSMAKTVTSMLIGIAIAEGFIRSVDDPAAAYVPELAGTEYGRTSLRHLLQMSSGVRFREDYSAGSSDIARLVLATYLRRGTGGVSAVTPFNQRLAPPGRRFSYSSAETQVLGLVLRAATGRPLAEYLEAKIWQPMGAEADATWLVDNSGQEAAFCCLNAVLRDYARLGLLLAQGGAWRGRQLIPAAWVIEATTVPEGQPYLRPGAVTATLGYGYQTWIGPLDTVADDRRLFLLWGVRGQRIYVDPRSRLVMVHTAVHLESVDTDALGEADALWAGVVNQLGR
jgi:CubicO group peptidase (beta-lactamase class C family)